MKGVETDEMLELETSCESKIPMGQPIKLLLEFIEKEETTW